MPLTEIDCDVVVVGGGSAGCVLAARLSENQDRSVVLLESGPDYPDLESMPEVIRGRRGYTVHGSVLNWTYEVHYVASRATTTPMTRGRVIGGSGSVNGCMFVRGLPEDYDSWHSPLWAWPEVLRCFKKLERDLDFEDELHGAAGPIPVGRLPEASWLPCQAAFLETALTAGMPSKADINRPEGPGAGPIPRNDPNGVRVSSAIGYLLPNRDRANLRVVGDCTVTKVRFEGKRACGVDASSGGQPVRVHACEVVLSAGAIATPQLLLLSGVGPADALRRLGIEVIVDLPGVGRNLRDHPMATLDLALDESAPRPAEAPRNQTVLVTTAPGSRTRNDLFLVPYSGFDSEPDPVSGSAPLTSEHLLVTLELPVGAGELTLAVADAGLPPRLDYHLLEEPWDRERLRYGVHLAAELLEGPAWRGLARGAANPAPDVLRSDVELDAWLAGNIRTALHSCGTARMGTDQLAVVDDRGRVRGLEGLRICDLSIAPDVPRANTNATAVMIGERIAELMVEN